MTESISLEQQQKLFLLLSTDLTQLLADLTWSSEEERRGLSLSLSLSLESQQDESFERQKNSEL
jgi:hypothetical protein